MSEIERWDLMGRENRWHMPRAAWWKRLPLIRHFRAKLLEWKVEQHNRMWRSMGSIPNGFDNWVVFGIWHGKESDA